MFASWLGIIPVAVFQQGEAVLHIPIIDDECQIPNEMLAVAKPISVSVYGGDRRTVDSATIEMVQSGFRLEHPPEPAEPTKTFVTSPDNTIPAIRYNNGFEFQAGEEWRRITGAGVTHEELQGAVDGLGGAIGQVVGDLNTHEADQVSHITQAERDRWNTGGGGQTDITVPPQFQWFLHPAGNIRGFKPSQNVSIQINVPASAVYAKKDFIYTVEPYEDGFIYPLSSYQTDLYIRGMNPKEVFVFKIKMLKGDTLISESIIQHTADSTSIDRVTILAVDNPLQDPIPMAVGDKFTFRVEVMQGTATSKTIYLESNVAGGYFTGITQNPTTVSSENVTHFRNNDTFTTVGYELRSLQAQIDSLNTTLKALQK